MPARYRSRDLMRENGTRWFNNNPGDIGGGVPTSCGFETCSDISGTKQDCEAFTVTRQFLNGGVIDKFSDGAFASQFRSYICDYCKDSSNLIHIGQSGIPSNSQLAVNAAARTNPSRPVVDVPVNILDIRRGLHRIYTGGRRLIDTVRRTGSRWLNYEFMVRPLVGDIVKAVNIHDQINRRIREINDLYDGNGIRKTVRQGSYTSSSNPSATVQSVGVTIMCQFDKVTTTRCSTHIRWAPTSRCGLKPSPRLIRALAVQAVYGGTIDLSTLWEIMPWSWMIDWFGNVGEYLSSNRNIIPARVTGVYPMKHTMTTGYVQPYRSGNGETTMTAITGIRESKVRVASSVTPSAHLPFLTGRQLGILSALAATRV